MQPRLSTPREDPDSPSTPLIVRSISSASEIPANASAQKKLISTDSELCLDISKKIVNVRNNINNNKEKIVKLQRNARYAQKCKDKKKDCLSKVKVESGAADEKQRKEIVKVQIIENLRKSLEENYNVYMARTMLNNYLLPRQANSIAVRAHHHLAWVVVSGVSHTETRDHPDRHNCLASVKCAKQFASLFANVSVIISQDDKAKVGLGVPAVSRTFSTLQSINEPVKVADYDFLAGFSQLLVLSWSFGTSLLTHMQNLQCLTQDPQYDEALKTNSKIRPIWMLLVNGGLDENLRHLKKHKNICQIFKKFNLDYLSEMATLSGKLAGITLPIDYFGTHLNTQGNVIHPELALQNFKYAAFCPVTQAKDRHFVNPFYLLEYCDYVKVPGYNLHCPSLDKLTYLHLCCPECKKYFPTLTFLTNHKRLKHPANYGRKPKRPFEQNSLNDCSVLPLHEVQ
ncbi:17413_t:CDS:2, partial [Gigaspora margarita]